MEFTNEQIEFMKSEEGKTLLNTNGVVTKVTDLDSIIETEEGLANVLKHSKVSAELDRRNSKSFEKFKTETLANYIEKSKLDEIENTYKSQLNDSKIDIAIEKSLIGAKHSELLKNQIDRGTLKIDDTGNVTGINEQLTTLKEKYADLFSNEPTPKKTPPATNSGGKIEITYEDYQKMSKEERRKVPNEILNKLLQS